jgi:hypothetical protein
MSGLAAAGSMDSIGSAAFDPHAQHAATGFGGGAAASSGGGAPQLGFEDAAFAVDDWRVMGDVLQLHRALLTKEQVRRRGGSGCRSSSCGLCQVSNEVHW